MKMVQKSTTGERINHWVMMCSVLVLLLTGLGFTFRSLNWLNTIFGGNPLASQIHKWGGILFGLSLLYSAGSYLGCALQFGAEDRAWIRMGGGYFSNVEIPPQDRLNAGQKIFYLLVFTGGIVMLGTGLILWLNNGSTIWIQVAHLLHNLAFLIFTVLIPLHIYLATAANPGTFRVMTRGTVPLGWARKHHGKWAQEAENHESG